MMGLGRKSNIVYLIDYGLSKKNKDEVFTGFSTSNALKKMAGTPIYASINAHMATGGKFVIINNLLFLIVCYKKDDLESLMYVLI